MKPARKIGIFLVIGLSFLIGLAVFGNYLPIEKNGVAPIIKGPSNKSFEPALKTENEKVLDNKQEELINNISQEVAESLRRLNPQGPTEFENQNTLKALNPETIARQVTARELARVDEIDLGLRSLAPITFTIISNEKAEIEKYLNNFNQVLKKELSNLSVDWDNMQSADFNTLALIHQKTYEKLAQLTVPQELAPLHRQQLKLVAQQRIILEKLAQAEQDPLAALAAIRASQDISRQFAQLSQQYNQYIMDNNINI